MNTEEAREIISSSEARDLMAEHKLDFDMSDRRNATEYIAEILVCLEAGITEPLRARQAIDRIDRRSNDPAQDRTPYFA